VCDPADAPMERATNWGTDLIVVGSQGRSAIGRLILGSVSRKVVPTTYSVFGSRVQGNRLNQRYEPYL
jgi:Universal stress protein family